MLTAQTLQNSSPVPAPRLPIAEAVLAGATVRVERLPEALVDDGHGQAIASTLKLLHDVLQPTRRLVRAGDLLYRAGERFDCLHVLNSGMVKVVKSTADGREQVVALKFRGDWLGLDGIAHGVYGCDGMAMDTGEVWAVRYDHLMTSFAQHPALLTALHGAMSMEISRERESLVSICTLPADARVADFLRFIAESMSVRGMRTDQITLRMTRAEIGNYLGLTLESVSRALSRRARDNIIAFAEKGRRELRIPDVRALSAFVQRCVMPESVILQ
jgi:CRP/FNR family transcriptional regulator